MQVHHFLGGNGRRGRVSEESHLAKNKAHVCFEDHQLITEKKIRLWWRDIRDRFGTLEVER